MPFTVREVQPTPNPNAMKLILDAPVSDHPASFFTPESAAAHPLAASLLNLPGVSSLLLLGDFITINKVPSAKWPPVLAAAREILEKA